MDPKRPPVYEQSGVLPFRFQRGELEILLISSRSGKRWVIPKGVIENGFTAVATASNEAFEEAGIRGDIDPQPVGEYRYRKWGGVCRVQVFLMEINEIAESWPEVALRSRKWMAPGEVRGLIDKRIPLALIKKMLAGIADKGSARNGKKKASSL